MFDIKLISNIEDEFHSFESSEITFSKSIEYNPQINNEIKKVYSRTLNNQAKFFIWCFHLNIFNTLERIIRNTNNPDDCIFDLSDFIAKYFDEVEKDLNIKNTKDLNELISILKLSSIVVDDALDENDMELIYESFYQIESRLKKEKLIMNELGKKHMTYDVIDINYEFHDATLNSIKNNNFD